MVQLVLALEWRGEGRPTLRTWGATAFMVARQVVLPPPGCEWWGSGPQMFGWGTTLPMPFYVPMSGEPARPTELGSTELSSTPKFKCDAKINQA